jgi:uncharacterized protein
MSTASLPLSVTHPVLASCPAVCGANAGLQPLTLGSPEEAARGNEIARRMPSIEFVELILTDNCNLRCSYCWEKDKAPRSMSEETVMAAIRFLLERSGPRKELGVLFFGGEPLLCFDLIKTVHAYATGRGEALGKTIDWTMTTNGTLLDEKHVVWLAKHRVKYLLSLDGVGEDHDRHRKTADGRGTFDRIAANIPLVKRYQPWLGTRMTLTPATVRNLRKNVEALHAMGINQFLFECAHGIPWTSEELADYETALLETAELYLEMKRGKKPFRMKFFEEAEPGQNLEKPYWGCGAGRTRCCVDPRGDIYGCSKLANITGLGNGVLPLGNVLQGFTRIENRQPLLDSTLTHRKKCAACDLQKTCAGGCPAINAAATGSIYEPEEMTCQTYVIFERVVQYFRRRYAEVLGGDAASQP